MARPAIPRKTAKSVRQNSGFCCVLCGQLPCEYEHIIPWATCREHKEENLTLLCPTCHADVTAGRVSKAAVKAAQEDPFAFRSGRASYEFRQNRVERLDVAGVAFDVCPGMIVHLIYFGGESIFRVRIEEYLPSYSGFLGGFGSGYVYFEDNVISVPTTAWDFELAGKGLRVFLERDLLIADIIFKDSTLKFNCLNIFDDGTLFQFGSDAARPHFSLSPATQTDLSGNQIMGGIPNELALISDGSFDGFSVFVSEARGNLVSGEARELIKSGLPLRKPMRDFYGNLVGSRRL